MIEVALMACSVRASELPTREDQESVSANNLNAFDTTRDLPIPTTEPAMKTGHVRFLSQLHIRFQHQPLLQKPTSTQWGLASERAVMLKTFLRKFFEEGYRGYSVSTEAVPFGFRSAKGSDKNAAERE